MCVMVVSANFWFVNSKANGALNEESLGNSYTVVLLRKLKVS